MVRDWRTGGEPHSDPVPTFTSGPPTLNLKDRKREDKKEEYPTGPPEPYPEITNKRPGGVYGLNVTRGGGGIKGRSGPRG